MGQFGFCVDMAEHAIEQIEQPLQIIMGIALRIRTKGLEQASALGQCDLLHAFHHSSSLQGRAREVR